MNSSQKFNLDWCIGWPFCTFLTELLLKTDPFIPIHHVTSLNSWPAFHCRELYRNLQAYFQHLISLVKTNEFNNNWTWEKIPFKPFHFRHYYTMFENIKINFGENCKTHVNLSACPVFVVVSWQKKQKLWSDYFLFFSSLSLILVIASYGHIISSIKY